ncbi:fungal-specific transcription factor domain-containing protein [Cunninghamella echinulata]|nr:fungal-specific transcription factor domain-containing protein [Cunninghamella echinulata]
MSSPLNWHPILSSNTTVPDQSLQSTQQREQQQHTYQTQNIHHSQPPLRPLQPLLHSTTDITQRNYEPYAYPSQFNNQQTLPDNFNGPDLKRIRISRACDTCRRKKVKCDTSGSGNTCKNCKTAKIECTYNDNAKKRGPPKGYIEVLENRLKRMEKILGGITNDKNETKHENNEEEDDDDDGDNDDIVENDNHNNKKGKKTKKVKKESVNYDTSHNSLAQNQSHFSPTDYNSTSPGPLSSPGSSTTTATIIRSAPSALPTEVQHPIIGTGTEINFDVLEDKKFAEAPTLSEIHPRYIGDMSTLPFLAEKFNFEDDRYTSNVGIKVRKFGQSLVVYDRNEEYGYKGSQQFLEKLGIIKPGETVNGLDDWILKVAGIDKVTSDRLMKIYFAYIHPGLPVINKSFFLKQYRGYSADFPSAPLLNAMYGAALRYIETCKVFGDNTAVYDAFGEEIDDFQIPEGGSEKFFENVIIYVKGRYNPNIATIQALVITQNHRASMDSKMTGGWLIIAAGIRMAQDLGLHRSSELWDIPESEKETRRRVWWAVYIMDKWSAASTGRPQTIFDEDCDEIYPSESAPWEEVLDISTDSNDGGQEPRFPSLDKSIAKRATCERIPIYQPFVQLIKLSEILGHVLQGLYTPQAKKYSAEHGSDAIVSCLDKALSDWRAALPPTLQISGSYFRKLDSKGKTPLLSISGLMYLSYCTLLILLHRPFIEKEGSEKTKSSLSSLNICISAAKKCVDIADKMHYRDFLLVSWNFAIYHVFTASLIHIHLATNSVHSISDESKSYIIKSIRVVKRLARFSIAAVPIHQVLLKLIKIGNIPYVDDDSDDNTTIKKDEQTISTSKYKRNNKSKSTVTTPSPYGNNKYNSNNSNTELDGYNSSNKLENLMTGMSPRISDVGRGQTPGRSQQSPDSQMLSNSILMQDDRSSSCSTPGSLINGDWINGLYSSIQDSETPVVNLGRGTDDSDPDSLRQFGMTIEQLFTPIDQLTMTNNTTTTNNNTPNTVSMNQQLNTQPYGLPQNFWFGFSNIGFGNGQSFLSTSYNNNNSNLFSSVPSNLQNQSTQPNNSNNNSIVNYAFQNSMPVTQSVPQIPTNNSSNNNNNNNNNNNIVDQSLFRNRPDNPFWSVPSSIAIHDWTAYLLPQNNNPQHSDQQQNQQTSPSVWL